MSAEKSAAIESIIGCGRFQLFLFICSQWIVFPQAWNLVAIVFNKVQPEWTCSNDLGEEIFQSSNTTLTAEQKCAIKSNCTNLTYSYEYYSLVAEWDLSCDREQILYLIMSISMAGVLVGAPIFGQLSDSFGRKWTLLADVLGIIVFGGASAAAPNWKVYCVLTFFIGFFCGGSIITGWVLMIELLSQKHRLWLPSVGGWPIAFAVLSLLAYLAKGWRMLIILINTLSIPSLGLILFIGESPRWLLQAGRTQEAIDQLRRVSSINRHMVDEVHWTNLTDAKPQENANGAKKGKPGKKYTYWHLFTNKKMALYTVVLSITFFCLSSISFGLTFNLDKLSGSIFMNFFYMACLRWIGGMITIGADLFIRGFGRKWGVILPSVLIALANTAVVILILTPIDGPSSTVAIRILLLSSAAVCSPMWIEMGLSNNELFPTPIRNMAVAFCSIFNRLGGVIMPQILYLGKFWKASPAVASLALSLCCAILFGIFIPETRGHPLPQQMPSRKTSRRGSQLDRSDSFAVYKFVGAEQTQAPLVAMQDET